MEDNSISMANYDGLLDPLGVSEENSVEFDRNFEPLARERANTWHAGLLYPGELDQPTEENSQSTATDQSIAEELETLGPGEVDDSPSVLPRKNVTRRNAWGQHSYSDLIVQAIESSPDQRATLAMIYEWMTKNIDYFRGKGDSNSSAGWKNSIRHNLSLQPRFMRVPNEGTGKSSWWVINHEASSKMMKAPPRRRASTMDTKFLEKRRTRPKKKPDVTTTPACSLNSLADSSVSEDVSDIFCGGSSRLDYRCRANSNASSVGRLSPISATAKYDNLEGHAVMQAIAQNIAGNVDWSCSDMDCDMLNDELCSGSDGLKMFHSLSVYDGTSSLNKRPEWEATTTMPKSSMSNNVKTLDCNISVTENETNCFAAPGVVQPMKANETLLVSETCVGSQQQHGINRLRSFLSNPSTQTILSSRPDLLSQVRKMIIDKRKQIMRSSSLPQPTPAQPFCSTLPQQLLTGGGIATGDANHANFEIGYQFLSGIDSDADLNQAIDQAFLVGDINLDSLPYELIGSEDLLASN